MSVSLLGRLFGAALALAFCAAAASPSPGLIARGHVLTLSERYLVFTTGDAVRLQPGLRVPSGIRMGTTVRVRIDPESRLVTALQRDDGSPEPSEIDAAAIPRDIVAVDPRSARTTAEVGSSSSNENAVGGNVAVTIHVTVPNFTPSDAVIYLSTDRTNFSSAELRMNRVSGFDWTITLPFPLGSTLRYDFTRGTPATVERQLNGTIFVPRTIVAAPGLRTHDTVARWADKY